jgi:alkaline phosphatase D
MHGDRAVFWSRTDRPANAMLEWSTTDSFKSVNRMPAVAALPQTDFTAKIMAEGLHAGQGIFYRERFQNLADINVESEVLPGRLRSAPAGLRDVSLVWSGDTVGQGWGIDTDRGDFDPF